MSALHCRADPRANLWLPASAAPRPAAERVLLVAVRRPPGFGHDHEPAGLQPMRMIVVLQGAARPAPRELIGPRFSLDYLSPEQCVRFTAAGRLRAVDGEVLRDETGRLFEKRPGHALRALGRIAAGPDGELLEVTGDAPGTLEEPGDKPAEGDLVAAPVRRRSTAARAERTAQARTALVRPDSERTGERNAGAIDNDRKADVDDREIRALLPAPGQWLQLRWSEWQAMLAPQVARPERVAEDYEIGVYLQVFEAARPMTVARAARYVFGDTRALSMLRPWTDALARQFSLGVGAGLPAPDARPGEPVRLPRGHRFFALRVASDPTAERPVASAPSHLIAAAALRTEVPARFQSAQLPLRTREQAIGEMQAPPTPPGWFASLASARRARKATEEWRAALQGRSAEEQLWSVSPPHHGLRDTTIRDWAARSLTLTGYEPTRMLLEWEIFWRQRGRFQ